MILEGKMFEMSLVEKINVQTYCTKFGDAS